MGLSFLDNAPNYLVGCVIQKRFDDIISGILFFLHIEIGNMFPHMLPSALENKFPNKWDIFILSFLEEHFSFLKFEPNL